MSACNPNNALFEPTPVCEKEIVKIIGAFKDSAAGWDGIKPSVIKHVKNFIKKPLMHISNLSFTSGEFPDELKLANVVPLYKSKDEMEFSNYLTGLFQTFRTTDVQSAN